MPAVGVSTDRPMQGVLAGCTRQNRSIRPRRRIHANPRGRHHHALGALFARESPASVQEFPTYVSTFTQPCCPPETVDHHVSHSPLEADIRVRTQLQPTDGRPPRQRAGGSWTRPANRFDSIAAGGGAGLCVAVLGMDPGGTGKDGHRRDVEEQSRQQGQDRARAGDQPSQHLQQDAAARPGRQQGTSRSTKPT